MRLLRRYLRTEINKMMRYGIRLRAIGNLRKLPTEVLAELRRVEAQTRANDRMLVQLAVSYGAREEIVSAVRRLARRVRDGRLDPAAIDEAAFESALLTAGVPDPDLLIRTSGEKRVSNFLLWQIAYTELYITDVLWPDFRRPQFLEALEYYKTRDRRYGRTSEQIAREA